MNEAPSVLLPYPSKVLIVKPVSVCALGTTFTLKIKMISIMASQYRVLCGRIFRARTSINGEGEAHS